jgi:hypothetical protein
MQQAMTMRQLTAPAEEAPQDAPESPEGAADEQQGRGPIRDAGEAQEATERPWWRRLLG